MAAQPPPPPPPPPSLEAPNTDKIAPEPDVVVPPDLPKESDSREPPKPEVNIIHREDATVEEYRVGGKLRYAKIIPKHGKPYYMVDTDGDGTLDTRYNDLENPPVNQWILMEW
ncbi:MAG: DUF2782 domain-containing protein [Gammaproteobacteria bacterium]|nr:DUF2782 domain-containing protein [Gammaproteobacteria bacterium]